MPSTATLVVLTFEESTALLAILAVVIAPEETVVAPELLTVTSPDRAVAVGTFVALPKSTLPAVMEASFECEIAAEALMSPSTIVPSAIIVPVTVPVSADVITVPVTAGSVITPLAAAEALRFVVPVVPLKLAPPLPIVGVVRLGDVANTSAPEPVSSEITPASSEEVVEAKA